jgi:tetratricopeptide (TPR) repeat protein
MQQFIGREDWLKRFQDSCLNAERGEILRIVGQPGIGKSSLLGRFVQMCEADKHPNTWLNVENFAPATGLEVLTELARSARFFKAEKNSKSRREKEGEQAVRFKEALGSVLEAGKLFDPSGGLIAGGAKVLLDYGMGLAGNASQISENAIAVRPELYLLEALAKAGEMKPVCMVDSWEHLLGSPSIKSRLIFGHGAPREGTENPQSLSKWLVSLFEYLQGKGWRIVIAGRNIHDSVEGDRLPYFSRKEILDAASLRPALAAYLPEQEAAMATVLGTLSFKGNPLWLQIGMNLLEKLLAEGEDLERLAQQPEYLHACFETDDPNDIGGDVDVEEGRYKLNLLDRLTRSIAGLDDQAWKIALPRVLDNYIVAQLFEANQARAIQHHFACAGVFRKSGKQFTLHEEIRDLLLAHARSKGWLDSDDCRALHGKLWDYLNDIHLAKLPSELRDEVSREGFAGLDSTQIKEFQQRIFAHIPINWMLEACYHRVMSQAELADKNIPPVEFWQALGGSNSLSFLEKWRVAEYLPDLREDQVFRLVEQFYEERREWSNMFGMETERALREAQLAGQIEVLQDLSFWEQRIRDHGLPGDYFGFQTILNDFYSGIHDERHVQVIDELLAHYGGATESEVQLQCATALFNKGVTLIEQLDDPEGGVDAYNELLERYGKPDAPEEMLGQCAKALYNKGLTLKSEFDDPQGEVDAYDELLNRYGKLDAPEEVLVACAAALFNKGVTLIRRLDDPQGAVDAYDELLERYGKPDAPEEVQVQCASALYNKGVTLESRLDDPQGEVDAYDELLNRYGKLDAPEGVQVACAKALFFKGGTLRSRFDDPQGEVDAYDELLKRYGKPDAPEEVQVQCVKALFNKGVTLISRLDDPEGGVDAYDELLKRYGKPDAPEEVQVRCAKALCNKGVTLISRLDDPEGGVDAYDELLKRYGKPGAPEGVQVQCLIVMQNSVEILLVLGRSEDAIRRIRQVLELSVEQESVSAIMHFLLWLADEETPLVDVLTAIRALPPEVEFNWNWSDIRPVVNLLPEARNNQAECFIAFFEQHRDLDQLENCLKGAHRRLC